MYLNIRCAVEDNSVEKKSASTPVHRVQQTHFTSTIGRRRVKRPGTFFVTYSAVEAAFKVSTGYRSGSGWSRRADYSRST